LQKLETNYQRSSNITTHNYYFAYTITIIISALHTPS